jgi:hypothetical protein
MAHAIGQRIQQKPLSNIDRGIAFSGSGARHQNIAFAASMKSGVTV